jgi:nucleoside-diphosphate-sugar epimerase
LLTGFKGKIIYDASKPDGQPRRRPDSSRARVLFGFDANVIFAEAVAETIAWRDLNHVQCSAQRESQKGFPAGRR